LIAASSLRTTWQQDQILLPEHPPSLHCGGSRVSATYWDRLTMTARIYKPARTAMQSGQAKTKEWMLDYEPEQPRTVEPLMGWTSSADMKQEVQIAFDTKEEAVAFCERQGIPYQVFETKPPVRPRISYSDNFAYPRREAWTH
jgi:hypothetical protein